MTLFSIAKKNTIGNLKNYIIYFVSMILSIVVYFAFVSLRYNDSVTEVIENFTTLESIFLMSSIVLILFSLVFIFYSNAFFIRKRKKEIGLYSLVGIPKKKIGLMLFFENFLLGVVSLILGIFLGLIFARLFAMILIRLIDNSLLVSFSLSAEPIINTIVVFLIIIFLTSLKSYTTIYKFKLVELFKNDNENLQMPTSSKLSSLLAVLSIILLIFGYIVSSKPLSKNNLDIILQMLTIIGSVIIGTYFLFRSLLPFVLKIIRGNKKSHYQDLNMINTSHLLFRIKGNINTFTITALLSTLTISLFATALSQYKSSTNLSSDFAPFTYTHLSKGIDYDNEIKRIIENDIDHPIKYNFDIPIIEIDTTFIGPDNYSPNKIRIIPEDIYNSISNVLYGTDPITISNNTAMAIQPLFTNYTFKDFEGLNASFESNGVNYNFTLSGMVVGRILTWDNPDFFIIINNTNFNELASSIQPSIFKAYEVIDENTTKDTASILKQLNTSNDNIFSSSKDNSQIFTYYEIYKSNLEESSLILFVICFLGFVFLTATGSVLYFKQLADATENKTYYNILFKLGITKKEIFYSIAKQNLFIFMVPLTITLIDSIIILNFLTKFISTLIGSSIVFPILISLLCFSVIYSIYYVLTIKTYTNITINYK